MKSRLNVGMRCTSVSEICVEIPCLVGAKSGVTAPRTSTAESWTACAVSGASTRVASERLTSTRSRLNGWNPIARTATVYGPPTSKPCTRYWPFERVRTEVVNPVPRLVTCTAASATGWPWGSVTLPVIAPVVTPWARATPAQSMVKSAAATRARPEPTIQRMDGPLLRRNGCRLQVPIETGRRWSPRGTPSRMLGGCFTQQIHGRDRNEKIDRPLRHGARLHRIELEGGLAAGLVAREVAERAANHGPTRADLAAVAVDRPLRRQHDRRVRRACPFALQHQIRQLP